MLFPFEESFEVISCCFVLKSSSINIADVVSETVRVSLKEVLQFAGTSYNQ